MDGEELRRRYTAGERNFAGLDLRGVNISGIDPDLDIVAYDELCPNFAADLSGINLSRANLTGAILAGANLTGANLSWSNLTEAALHRCNLTKTDLSWSNLTRACLSGAEFQSTDMRGADFLHADISETPYFGGDVTGAKNIDTVNFGGTPVHGLVLDDGTVIDSEHDW